MVLSKHEVDLNVNLVIIKSRSVSEGAVSGMGAVGWSYRQLLAQKRMLMVGTLVGGVGLSSRVAQSVGYVEAGGKRGRGALPGV